MLGIRTIITWFKKALSTKLFFHTQGTGLISRNCSKANGEYTRGEYSCLISLDLSIQMKMKVFLSALSLVKEHIFSLEGSFSKAECSVHKSGTLILNRDKVELWQLFGLLQFGSYPRSPHSLQMSYNTVMHFDKGTRYLITKILYLSSLSYHISQGRVV